MAERYPGGGRDEEDGDRKDRKGRRTKYPPAKRARISRQDQFNKYRDLVQQNLSDISHSSDSTKLSATDDFPYDTSATTPHRPSMKRKYTSTPSTTASDHSSLDISHVHGPPRAAAGDDQSKPAYEDLAADDDILASASIAGAVGGQVERDEDDVDETEQLVLLLDAMQLKSRRMEELAMLEEATRQIKEEEAEERRRIARELVELRDTMKEVEPDEVDVETEAISWYQNSAMQKAPYRLSDNLMEELSILKADAAVKCNLTVNCREMMNLYEHLINKMVFVPQAKFNAMARELEFLRGLVREAKLVPEEGQRPQPTGGTGLPRDNRPVTSVPIGGARAKTTAAQGTRATEAAQCSVTGASTATSEGQKESESAGVSKSRSTGGSAGDTKDEAPGEGEPGQEAAGTARPDTRARGAGPLGRGQPTTAERVKAAAQHSQQRLKDDSKKD